jgi:mRNA interferase RelE/StbE
MPALKYTIRITSKAKKDFKKLDPKIQKHIQTSILSLQTNRTPQQFKPLVGHKIAQYRLRMGDYRVLYDVYNEDKVVLVLRIGHRKEIYT